MAIPVQAENKAKPSPPSLFHFIYDVVDVVDVGAFSDFFVCYLLAAPKVLSGFF